VTRIWPILFTLAWLCSLAGAAMYIILVWADVNGYLARAVPILAWLIATCLALPLGAAALVTGQRTWTVPPYLFVWVLTGLISFAIILGALRGPLNGVQLLLLLGVNSGAAYLAWWLLLHGWTVPRPNRRDVVNP